MGCASSSPLVESGKNFVETAKDQAGDVVAKGEQTLQDVGEKVSEELDHVKGAMKSALDTAENSIGSMMGKVSNNIDSTKSEINEHVNNMEEEAEETLNRVSDSANEAISEAETVLASEVENTKKTLSTNVSETLEKVDSTKDALKEEAKKIEEKVENALYIEDVEQEHFDGLGDSVDTVEKKVEEIVAKLPTPVASPVKEPEKMEPPPTFWEAQADAILEQKSFSKSVEIDPTEVDTATADNTIIESNSEDILRIEEDSREKEIDILRNELHSKTNEKIDNFIISSCDNF